MFIIVYNYMYESERYEAGPPTRRNSWLSSAPLALHFLRL
jgi:hypothetical protein